MTRDVRLELPSLTTYNHFIRSVPTRKNFCKYCFKRDTKDNVIFNSDCSVVTGIYAADFDIYHRNQTC